MSLDTNQIHQLKSKKFDSELYVRHEAKWKEMVRDATKYVKTYVQSNSGDEVRPGDISLAIQNAVRVDPQFENYVAKKSLTQKYWVALFSDFIVEKVYPQPKID